MVQELREDIPKHHVRLGEKRSILNRDDRKR